MESGNQITTLTFYKYVGWQNKLWAFSMMQFAHARLKKVDGLEFYKLLGSGKENFDPRPDFSVYGVLQVWENESSAHEYFEQSSLSQSYRKRSTQQLTFYLKNIQAHGQWSKKNPFDKSAELDIDNPYIAVITRATIKLSMLDVLDNHNERGHLLFQNLYKKNPIGRIFSFLDEETSIIEELKIMLPLTSLPFIKGFFKRLF